MLTGPSSSGRCSEDGGGSLILMPAAVLVVLLLGAIAFDLSWVYVAQRELIDVASSAANDAVTYGLEPGSLRDGSGGQLVDRRVREAVDRSLAIHRLSGLDPNRTVVTIDDGDQVTVSLVRHVNYVFGRNLPGGSNGKDVNGSASATVVQR
ncbi:MAG: Tad domain-containing protein [Actinobacteria bacterium]|nr:Tad domain-containing protein [Actinomycetota bacterium]